MRWDTRYGPKVPATLSDGVVLLTPPPISFSSPPPAPSLPPPCRRQSCPHLAAEQTVRQTVPLRASNK